MSVIPLLWTSVFAQEEIKIPQVPFAYTIDLLLPDFSVQEKSAKEEINNNITTDTVYEQWTILASLVDPRSEWFATFPGGSCTEYVARQRPELFINEDGSRRITGNAEDRLRNAQRLWLETGKKPKQGAIAVFYEGRWGRQHGHVAYVEQIQSNGMIIVSEMNYDSEYIITYRVIPEKLAAGYIY